MFGKHAWVRWMSAGLVWSLVCSTATATAGKRKHRGAEVAGKVSLPSVDVLQVERTFTQDVGLMLPLDASATGLDLKTLARSKVTFTLSVADPGLVGMNAMTRRGLELHLAADARWRVTSRNGSVMAIRRAETAEGWTVDVDGVHESAQGAWHAALMLGGETRDSPWSSGSLVSHGDFGGEPIELVTAKLAKGPWQGHAASALFVSGPGVALRLFEAGADTGREHTTGLIEALDEELARSIAVADMTIADGYAMMAMPRGEPGKPHPLTLSEKGEDLEVRARLDPGAAGWTWVRLMVKGKSWEEDAVAAGTRERIGHSAQGGAGFLLQGRFPRSANLKGSVVAEVWFLEDGAAQPRRLMTQEVEVLR
jgi:hypothetical protein